MSIGLQHPLNEVGGKSVLVHREHARSVHRPGSKTHHELEPRRRIQRSQDRNAKMDKRLTRNVINEIPRSQRTDNLGEPQENRNRHFRVLFNQQVPCWNRSLSRGWRQARVRQVHSQEHSGVRRERRAESTLSSYPSTTYRTSRSGMLGSTSSRAGSPQPRLVMMLPQAKLVLLAW